MQKIIVLFFILILCFILVKYMETPEHEPNRLVSEPALPADFNAAPSVDGKTEKSVVLNEVQNEQKKEASKPVYEPHMQNPILIR